MGILSITATGAALTASGSTAAEMDQIFTFGPTGYALLTVALFAIVWRFLRPPKQQHHHQRRRTAKPHWE